MRRSSPSTAAAVTTRVRLACGARQALSGPALRRAVCGGAVGGCCAGAWRSATSDRAGALTEVARRWRLGDLRRLTVPASPAGAAPPPAPPGSTGMFSEPLANSLAASRRWPRAHAPDNTLASAQGTRKRNRFVLSLAQRAAAMGLPEGRTAALPLSTSVLIAMATERCSGRGNRRSAWWRAQSPACAARSGLSGVERRRQRHARMCGNSHSALHGRPARKGARCSERGQTHAGCRSEPLGCQTPRRGQPAPGIAGKAGRMNGDRNRRTVSTDTEITPSAFGPRWSRFAAACLGSRPHGQPRRRWSAVTPICRPSPPT